MEQFGVNDVILPAISNGYRVHTESNSRRYDIGRHIQECQRITKQHDVLLACAGKEHRRMEQLVEQVELCNDHCSPCRSGACNAIQQFNEPVCVTDIYLEHIDNDNFISFTGGDGYGLYAKSDT
jgi:hypothetical protein